MQNVRILKIYILQDLLDPRRLTAVEMHADRIEDQPEGGLTPGTARMDRAQEGILDPHQRHTAPGGQSLAAPGGRAAAPDQHAIARAGQAKAQLVPGKLQHPVQAPVAQKGQVLVAQSPGNAGQPIAPARHGAVSCPRSRYWPGSTQRRSIR